MAKAYAKTAKALAKEEALLPVKALSAGDLAGTAFDYDNPLALINLVPPLVRAAIENAPITVFSMTEADIEQHMTPSVELSRLRMALWRNIATAQQTTAEIEIKDICTGSKLTIYQVQRLLRDSHAVAYVLCPLPNYQDAMEEMLMKATHEMRRVLQIPHIDIDGMVDHKLLKLKYEIYNMLDQRAHGAYTQKLNITTNSGGGSMSDPTKPYSMKDIEQIDKKIERLIDQQRVSNIDDG